MRAKTLGGVKAAVIVLLGLWVYSPAFHGEWLWDDNTDITQNSVVRDPAALAKIWFAPRSIDYYPLKTSVQWVQWRLWGMDSFGYHLTNVMLHLLSAFLFWYLLRQLRVKFAYAGALLFTVHPLAVESVAWVVELKNALSLPLLLGAMIAWVKWDTMGAASLQDQGRDGLVAPKPGEGGRPARPDSAGDPGGARTGGPPVPTYLLSVVLFLAAMLSKTSVVMFPLVLLLYAWWKRGRISRRDLLASAPFFALSLALGLVTLGLQHRMLDAVALPTTGLSSRLAVAGLATAFYFFKCLVPINLMPIYPHWQVEPPAAVQFLPWLAIAGVLCWLLPARQSWRRDVLFGLGFFWLNLVPVLGFVPMAFQRLTWVMDHLAYISLLGLIGLAVAGLGALAERPSIKTAAWLAAATAVAGLAFASHRAAQAYATRSEFWASALERNPEAWAAEYNLALTLVDAGRLPEAIVHLDRAVQLKPDYLEAQNNLANALCQVGQVAAALPHFEVAVRLSPNAAVVHYNFGLALRAAGRPEEARAQWEEAARLAAASR